jgi:hypothetical protein
VKKVIFLDIDGVLNVITKDFDEYGAIFQEPFVSNLKTLIDQTSAQIVISSTWRYSGLKAMKEMWQKRGLAGEVIDITPHGDGVRGDEIDTWLKKHDVTRYVIIDDDDDMLDHQMPFFVKTSENFTHMGNIRGYGLTTQCTIKAVSILNDYCMELNDNQQIFEP